ncbi:hypothetical protein HYALB_00000632 [Hymenoscyphus albidus]|uniref:Uncharacterized protein n=1 Tax=Hymenoscyphus albidus TaxID=595503 RepID=A0A9N9M0Z2_9HELO|nr:hypothetical protein HYALB_00000632 [Hymenoscyphus albidus]
MTYPSVNGRHRQAGRGKALKVVHLGRVAQRTSIFGGGLKNRIDYRGFGGGGFGRSVVSRVGLTHDALIKLRRVEVLSKKGIRETLNSL